MCNTSGGQNNGNIASLNVKVKALDFCNGF